uniref:Secreted protein n=1 Tax=Knipowitschia caucasica TaxID=637954 RepID=A0AAV2MGA8_KNICA
MSLGLGVVVARLVTGSLIWSEPAGPCGRNTLSCSWDKSGPYRLSPSSHWPLHTRAATLKGSRCSVHVCPALGPLERSRVASWLRTHERSSAAV